MKEDKRFIDNLQNIFNETQSTYKFWWFLAICEKISLSRINENISFNDLSLIMFQESFYAIKHGVLFCNPKSIKKADGLRKFIENNSIIKPQLDNILLDKFKKEFSKKVKYRILTPFYNQKINDLYVIHKKEYLKTNPTKTEKEFKKIWEGTGSNKFVKDYHIEKLSQEQPVFYTINKDETISICEWSFNFIKENNYVLQGFAWHHLINKLNKINKSCNKPNFDLLSSLWDEDKTRQMSFIINVYTTTAMIKPKNPYNENKVIDNNLSIDHIVPFSFVQSDELWNLVPTTKSINSAKNDRIPNLDKYFKYIAECQWELFNTLRKKDQSLCEKAYASLNLPAKVEREDFCESLKTKLYSLSQLALKNGFQLWQRN